MTAPILCLVGPPGVGKTSLGQSVARALGRPFHRIALGGIRDEAEIRGHRRTYIGALPGRIIQALRKVKCKNPVILLDEIDKVSRGVHGDPSSALLEVLDPAQNNSFTDHYLGTPFDLSNVLFMATANSLTTISQPLMDRMDVIQLSGYSLTEKMEIANKHLYPKQLRENGIDSMHMVLQPSALLQIAISYTREAGVRQLERVIGSICRYTAVKLVEWRGLHNYKDDNIDQSDSIELKNNPDSSSSITMNNSSNNNENLEGSAIAIKDISSGFEPVVVDVASLNKILGTPKYSDKEKENCAVGLVPGAVFGLAWTAVGGVLLVIEAVTMPGTGKLRLTGQLGDVMKESVLTALSWIRTHAKIPSLGIPGRELDTSKLDVHIHFPAAAVPKDGPSAGVAITTALVSALSGRCARRNVAMTGEISLTGRVLPVGGIKEKLLAAHRHGVTTVVIPVSNEMHLDNIPSDVKTEMECVLASEVMDVLDISLPTIPSTDTSTDFTTNVHTPLSDKDFDWWSSGGSASIDTNNDDMYRSEQKKKLLKLENKTLELSDQAVDYLTSYL